MKRRKRRLWHAGGRKRMRTALQVIVSTLSLSLLYYRMRQMRHRAPTPEGEEPPSVRQTP